MTPNFEKFSTVAVITVLLVTSTASSITLKHKINKLEHRVENSLPVGLACSCGLVNKNITNVVKYFVRPTITTNVVGHGNSARQ